MNKNIIILGAPRSGKTFLARKISIEKGYSLISIDDLVCAFENLPECNIKHDGNDKETAKNISPFLKRLFVELSEGPNFYNGVKYVIEGTHFQFDYLIPFLLSDKYKEKYKIIGLTYNEITKEDLYNNIKKYDTEDDWTYYCTDEELLGDVKYFLDVNSRFNNYFKKYEIETFDTSCDRNKVLNGIMLSLEDLNEH